MSERTVRTEGLSFDPRVDDDSHAAAWLRRLDEVGGISCPQRVVFSIDDLPGLLDQLGLERVLVVCSREALRGAQLDARLRSALGRHVVGWFDGFTPNPKSYEGERAAQLAAESGARAILGIGGGSCLDVAKTAALGASMPARARELSRGEGVADASPLPIVAVPTTAGTGSETTHFCAIYVDGRKVSIAHPGLRPVGVVLDASVHMSLPRALAAATGLDALCQALESIWAVGATEASLTYAHAAGRLIARHLAQSVRHAELPDRRAMLIGAHAAGRAINISKTTAAHALSYELTTRHGISHGVAAALTVGHVGAANAQVAMHDCADPRGPEHVRARVRSAAGLLGVEPPDLPSAVRELMRSVGVPASLSEAGVPREVLGELATAADPVRSSNNPRRLDVAAIEELLARAW